MTVKLRQRVRRGAVMTAAFAMLAVVVASPATQAKATKKKATTRKAAATTRKKTTATTAKAATKSDDGPAKNITGMEVAPGAPIKVGVMWSDGSPDTSGKVGEAYEIAFDVLRKKGELPVYGRDVVVVARPYPFNAPDVQAALRASCTALAQDDRVFVGLTWAGPADCLAGDFKIPAIGGALTDQQMARSFPYGFSFQWNANTDMQNLPYWADSLGLLKGRKLGIFHGNAAGRQQQIDDYFKPELKKLGYKLLEDMASVDEAGDRVAVQRLKSAGVDTIFMASARPGDFGRAAQAQGYRPKFLIGGGPEGQAALSDGSPARLNMTATMYDNAYGMVWRRIGENGLPGNPPTNPAGTECAENYEKYSGQRVRQTGTAFEQNRWASVQWTCDGARAVVTALKAAGPNLTQGSFINAMETSIKGQPSGLHFDYNFSRTNHFGTNLIKTIQLDGECLCWRTKSSPKPPWVQ